MLQAHARECARTRTLSARAGLDGGRLGDRLAVGDLRRADLALHVELAHHAIADDLQVQLAHALDHLRELLSKGPSCGG